MLEASGYVSFDIVSPFTGAIVDKFCGLFESAKAANVFMEYVEVARCMYEMF